MSSGSKLSSVKLLPRRPVRQSTQLSPQTSVVGVMPSRSSSKELFDHHSTIQELSNLHVRAKR